MVVHHSAIARVPIMHHKDSFPDIWQPSSDSLLELISQLPVGLIVFEDDFFSFCNQSAYAIISVIHRSPLTNLALTDVVHALFGIQKDLDSNYLYAVRVTTPHAQTMDLEFSIIRRSGQCRWSFIVVQDVSELHFYRDALEDSDKLLVIGELAAGLAHEIRNPLASLRGFTQMLQQTSKTTKTEQYTDIMLSELDRINSMVEELLELAKPRRQPFYERPLTDILQSVLLLLGPQATVKSCYIANQSAILADRTIVRCQPNKLKQAFINMIKNAIEAAPCGSSIDIQLTVHEENIQVDVTDQGPGIPDNIVDQLGKKFISNKPEGTGLGFLLSHTIIREHNGTIHVRRRPEGGTTVSVRLPIANALTREHALSDESNKPIMSHLSGGSDPNQIG